VVSPAGNPAAGHRAVTAADVLRALEAVPDPHVPASLRAMGMVAGVTVGTAGQVTVRVRVPCTACPGTAMIRDGIRAAVAALPGAGPVEVEQAWEDPWHRDLVDVPVRDLMHRNGIQI
jgi:metal-sulfur cluster biosynthetic enzyme